MSPSAAGRCLFLTMATVLRRAALSGIVLLSMVPVCSADILDDLKARQAQVRTVTVAFTQEKHTKLLAAPLRSSGTFTYRQPDRIRWEYRGKVNMLVVSTGKELWIYYPDLKEADVIIGVPPYEALMHFDIGRLSREYEIKSVKGKDLVRLKFTPKTKGPVSMIEMEFAPAASFPQSLRLTDSKGEVTKITFGDAALNKEVREDLFTFVPDSGVRVRQRSMP